MEGLRRCRSRKARGAATTKGDSMYIGVGTLILIIILLIILT
ncbi:MAG TPA: hypothetical protein VK960_10690 [Acidimicrobiia bacterium]|nr:hypothetical protein [Acidimicrobiia bacterium]